MIINGVWYDNITCPKCRRRHPAEFDCATVRGIAENAAALRVADNEATVDANREVRIKLAEQITDQQARIAELEAELEEWRFTNKVDELERELVRRGERIAELEKNLHK